MGDPPVGAAELRLAVTVTGISPSSANVPPPESVTVGPGLADGKVVKSVTIADDVSNVPRPFVGSVKLTLKVLPSSAPLLRSVMKIVATVWPGAKVTLLFAAV